MGPYRLAVLMLAAVLGCAGEAVVAAGKGRSIIRDGVLVVVLQGSPEEIGVQEGRLLGLQAKLLVGTAAADPVIAVLRRPEAQARIRASLQPGWLAELGQVAKTAGIDEAALIAANSAIEMQCTAVAHRPPPGTAGPPLMLARNMDFPPADVLGTMTVVKIIRPEGRHAFASISWAGLMSVVSGMNDSGVVVCSLLRMGSHGSDGGMPLFFCMRAMLEECATVEEAAARFRATPTSSGHYVFIADPERACVVWHDGAAFHRTDIGPEWLGCTNAAIPERGQWPGDRRGRFVRELAGRLPTPDLPAMRGLLAGTYLDGINAQAMVFVPAERRLQLALGSSVRPAALSPWHDLDLAGLLAGKPLEGLAVMPVPATAPGPRWDE